VDVPSRLLELLGDVACSDAETSWKPCFSEVGLSWALGVAGVARVHLHHGRRTTTLTGRSGGPVLAAVAAPGGAGRGGVLDAVWPDAGVRIIAAGRNAWLLRASSAVRCDPCDPALAEVRVAASHGHVRWDAYVPRQDPRDPDAWTPFAWVLRVVTGSLRVADGSAVVEPVGGAVLVLCQAALLDEVDDLPEAPATEASAWAAARCWWSAAIGPWDDLCGDAATDRLTARALQVLVSNGIRGTGDLSGRVAVVPNRGAYPCPFLWDSCFHAVGLAGCGEGLAEDALLSIAGRLRCDGLMPHFLCPTWRRPELSQPPLAGWAALTLCRRWPAERARALAAEILPSLRRNTAWWLRSRMTRHGLIACPDPMETGNDDTPRLDRGPVLAVDMHTHLIGQCRAAAELARLLGEDPAPDLRHAEALRTRLRACCWDPVAGLFADVLVADGQQHLVPTPSAFFPFLVDAAGDADADRAIDGILLDPARFFGPVPFPSVAYDHPAFVPAAPEPRTAGVGAACWRGPVWIPHAWFLLDLLEQRGRTVAAAEARERLWRHLAADGDLHESLHAITGAGLGARQYGWTAAFVLDLARRRVQGRR
jgi:hypothetical protein